MKRSPISNHSSILNWKNPYASSIVRMLNSCAKLICARNFLDDNSKLLYFLFHWTESPFCNHRLKYHMDWDIRLAEFQIFSLKLVRFNGFLSVFFDTLQSLPPDFFPAESVEMFQLYCDTSISLYLIKWQNQIVFYRSIDLSQSILHAF